MKKNRILVFLIVLAALVLVAEIYLININSVKPENNTSTDVSTDDSTPSEDTVSSVIDVTISEDYETIYSPGGNKGYRYGPSIMKHDDGTIDMWMSRPGNNSTMWDYISYRHYDGNSWSSEEIVLTPTPGSKDQCSCCDPGVIYFDGYYYLAYTGTYSSELNGANNSAFVARSKYPDGPYEKWNGSSWGGSPEPIIEYDNDPNYWGIGEVSFVSDGEDLFIYYSFINDVEISVRLCKADLVEDWPLTIREKGSVSDRDTIDSYDIVYDENLKTYIAFTIKDRMSEISSLEILTSSNGKNFEKVCTVKGNIMDYAHNMGIMKDESGHINSSDTLTIGYAYGKNWGSWSMILQDININLING
ncbi:MAG: hypothetical protein Q4D13_02450 [Erysipelotrichaceae bacterium]|nr:hypothetical protein [Erysipelotrichaceae bacterium]